MAKEDLDSEEALSPFWKQAEQEAENDDPATCDDPPGNLGRSAGSVWLKRWGFGRDHQYYLRALHTDHIDADNKCRRDLDHIDAGIQSRRDADLSTINGDQPNLWPHPTNDTGFGPAGHFLL